MPQPLNLIHGLLENARRHMKAGRSTAADKLLKHLLHFEALPLNTRREALELRAQAARNLNNHRRARRLLHAALVLAPDSAELHFQLAQCCELDEATPDWDRAVKHYRRAVRLSPEKPEYHHALGRLLCELGQRSTGLSALKKAHALAPDKVEYLRDLFAHLLDAGKVQAAQSLAVNARFALKSECGSNQLWSDMQFALTRQAQLHRAEANRETILKFRRAARVQHRSREEATILRIDGPSAAQPHLPRKRRSWLAN